MGVALAAEYTMRANESAAWAAELNPALNALPDVVAEFHREFNHEHAAPMVSGQIESVSQELLTGMERALAQAGDMQMELPVEEVAEQETQMGTNRGGPDIGRG